jgi:nucleoside-diphosphate-sugar epimerase
MHKKTVLFGPSGFLGPAILSKYPEIIAVGRKSPPFYCRNKFIKVESLNDLSKLDKIKISKVIFLIGNSNHHVLNKSNLEKSLNYNLIPLKKALNYFSNRKLKKFISFSGALVYDEHKLKVPCKENSPLNSLKDNYIFSKYMAEKTIETFSDRIPWINIRLSNIYGPSLLDRPDIVISIFRKILKKKTIKIKSFKPRRDFIHIDDVAEGVIRLLNTNYIGHVNLGTGVHSSIKEVCDNIEKVTKKQIYSLDQKVSGPYVYAHNIDLLKKITKWEPKISLKKGLEMTWIQLLAWKKKIR